MLGYASRYNILHRISEWHTGWPPLYLIYGSFQNFFEVFCCCSSTVVSISPPPLSPAPPTPPPTLNSAPLWFVHGSFIRVPDSSSHSLPSYPPPSSPPVTVFVLYFHASGFFSCLFVLLIRFQLKVRSYGICPSLPSLFHLA